jgi:succinate dehydrogenase / fumarate reductase cytochrome b subunit
MAQSYDRGTVESFGRWREFKAGMWAWILHKLTGWILVGYLFTHIAVLSTAIGVDPSSSAVAAEQDAYTLTLGGLEELLVVRFLEIGLLAVAVFYILNGIRLLFVDLGLGLDRQDASFYVSLIMTAAITLASLPTFLGGAL